VKAFVHYFLIINAVNLPASIAIAIVFGISWLPIAFCTFGLLLGLLSYNAFFKNQYYLYYNLGYTKPRLVAMVLACNTFISVPVVLLILLLL
jgi:hypothetical protein